MYCYISSYVQWINELRSNQKDAACVKGCFVRWFITIQQNVNRGPRGKVSIELLRLLTCGKGWKLTSSNILAQFLFFSQLFMHGISHQHKKSPVTIFSIFGWWSWKNLLPKAQFRYENKIYRLLSMSIQGHSKLIVCFCQNENVHMMTFIKNIKYWLSKFFPFNTLPFVAFYIFLVRFPFSFNITSKIALELKFYWERISNLCQC